MMDDIVLNKKESIERCVKQIRIYFAMPSELAFEDDFLKQDAIAINLQRAAEQCIDLANHLVKIKKLGIPKESKDAFTFLANAGLITQELSKRLKSMVGFRNILVHEYQDLELRLMREIIEHHLDDLILFTECVLEGE
ncbi:DUF86 domain-containing protein [candidate division KSB1 bacterium]|nr:DUF86 domain-containing protein [candidate division KSB1 bacterium]